MITISLCMIVKNEEIHLQNCLNSIADLVDEIIIVDTGSQDKTKEIARHYTDKIYDFVWVDDFSKARNYSFDLAKMEYCMWMDADDVLKDRQAFLQLKRTLKERPDIILMKYVAAFDANHEPTFIFYRERLIKKEAALKWEGMIHEVIPLKGTLLYQDIAIEHRKQKVTDSDRNLRIFEKMIQDKVPFSHRDEFYYARELMDHQQYERAGLIFSSLIDCKQAWLENRIEACKNLATCQLILNQPEEALFSLLKSFSLAAPRAEICCDIGLYFLNKQDYSTAIYWYLIAMQCKKDMTKGGFIILDCYDFIPAVQLCVCYYALKDEENAAYYHQLSGKFKPHHPIYLHNCQFFKETSDK